VRRRLQGDITVLEEDINKLINKNIIINLMENKNHLEFMAIILGICLIISSA
jgi:hypothetical protein